MFKLVVLCALLAVAVAEPGAIFAAPLAYSSTVLSPATTTISKQASSVVHPSPYYYSGYPFGYSHYIKKRSAPLALATGYYAPTTYFAPGHLAAPAFASPVIRAPIYSPLAYAAPAHFIKKRSVALALPSTYVAPTTYAAPLLTSTYSHAAPFLHSTPLISHAPFAYSHFIKKRSAPLFTSAYLAPTSYSTQSRIDVQHSAPLYPTYSHTIPLAYSTPIGYSHIL